MYSQLFSHFSLLWYSCVDLCWCEVDILLVLVNSRFECANSDHIPHRFKNIESSMLFVCENLFVKFLHIAIWICEILFCESSSIEITTSKCMVKVTKTAFGTCEYEELIAINFFFFRLFNMTEIFLNENEHIIVVYLKRMIFRTICMSLNTDIDVVF